MSFFDLRQDRPVLRRLDVFRYFLLISIPSAGIWSCKMGNKARTGFFRFIIVQAETSEFHFDSAMFVFTDHFPRVF